jgi:hypothetical protein
MRPKDSKMKVLIGYAMRTGKAVDKNGMSLLVIGNSVLKAQAPSNG